MKPSICVRTLVSILAGSLGPFVVGCSPPSAADSASIVGVESAAAHSFCGNGRCDHGETCSTCSEDCGTCSGAGGAGGGGSSGTGGSGAGGSTGICGSNAAPPAQ